MTTLDHNELLDLATKYSRENLRDFGEVPPTLIAATPDGIVIYNPEKLSSGDDMKQFALVAQLVVIGFSAHAVAIILQSWSLFSAGSGKPAVRPSDSPDRKEVVLISAESPSSEEQRLLFIQRDVMGTFTDFAPDDPRPFDEMEAPFARIYSSEVASSPVSSFTLRSVKTNTKESRSCLPLPSICKLPSHDHPMIVVLEILFAIWILRELCSVLVGCGMIVLGLAAHATNWGPSGLAVIVEGFCRLWRTAFLEDEG